MARDRVERILQTFFCRQEEARPTKIITPYRWRVLAYAQDSDGEVKGSLDICPLNPQRLTPHAFQ
jgi:hypothetical protein